jgi:shikimate kinase
MRIFIVGYMGSGKSTFGPRLARELDHTFADLDQVFEARYKISIPDFFRKYGEPHFRELEHSLLSEFVLQDDFVLASGGGTPCYHHNMDLMNRHGITVYLNVPLSTLVKRLKDSPKKRPLLKAFDEEEYEKQIREHLGFRKTFYKQAQLVLEGNCNPPAEVADRLRQIASHLSGV